MRRMQRVPMGSAGGAFRIWFRRRRPGSRWKAVLLSASYLFLRGWLFFGLAGVLFMPCGIYPSPNNVLNASMSLSFAFLNSFLPLSVYVIVFPARPFFLYIPRWIWQTLFLQLMQYWVYKALAWLSVCFLLYLFYYLVAVPRLFVNNFNIRNLRELIGNLIASLSFIFSAEVSIFVSSQTLVVSHALPSVL